MSNAEAVMALALALAATDPAPPAAPPPKPAPFAAALALAGRSGRPLAVFVGQPAPEMAGWVTARDDALDQPAPCVVVLYRGEWHRLRGRPSAAEVRDAFEPRVRVQAPPPMPPMPPFRPTARSGC
jgi:hypothetical protein